jgi:hypothetical protein
MVDKTLDNDGKASILKASDAASKKEHRDISGYIAERLKRFRDYLIAKGFSTERNPENLRVFLQRGQSDVETCSKELDEPFFESCSLRCLSTYGADVERLDVERLTACDDNCPHPVMYAGEEVLGAFFAILMEQTKGRS